MQVASEGVGAGGRQPCETEPMGPDTISRRRVSKLSEITGHSAAVTELLGVGTTRTHLMSELLQGW